MNTIEHPRQTLEADESLQAGTTEPGAGLNRRRFFKVLGCGLAVVIVLKDLSLFAAESSIPVASPIPAGQVGAWIHIGEDGVISVFTGKTEVGQNIRTSLSQAVAEELYVPLSSIKMIMADTDLVPYDAGTFGSRSTPQMGTQLRTAAATARRALLDMAAKNWNTETTFLQVQQGMITDQRTGKKITYGQLAKGQQLLMPVSKNAETIPAADWKIAGTSVPKVNGTLFLTGKHQYVSDMKLPGMLYGKVLRPPSFNAKLLKADLSSARAMPGVTVLEEGNLIAVAAPDLHIAAKALKAIQAEWQTIPQPSRAEIFDYLLKNATGGRDQRTEDHSAAAPGSAEITLNSTYHINYIAHVPLEPRAALAQWIDGKLTVWTGTQSPFGVQRDLADEFAVSKDKVRVIVPDTGSAYGGKHSVGAAIEAAHLARAAQKPVKLVWTREEEFTWAYFRPAGVITVDSSVKKDGTITSWKFDNYNSGPAAINSPYRVRGQQSEYHPSKTPLSQGSYRGLASTANVFAREAHMTDLAQLLNMDQLEFRLKNLDDPRLRTVLEAAAKSFNWSHISRQAGHGYGIAAGYEKGGYVATCAEVIINGDKEVKVIRITEAFECGAIVNPDHLENQVLGAIVQGLGGALFEAIDFADGKILNPRLSAYRVPRFSDVPMINMVLINRKDLPPAGAGEAPIMGVAPAIRNAILDASGIGLKILPLVPSGSLS